MRTLVAGLVRCLLLLVVLAAAACGSGGSATPGSDAATPPPDASGAGGRGGTSGAAGASGASGTSGTTGASGASGTTGASGAGGTGGGAGRGGASGTVGTGGGAGRGGAGGGGGVSGSGGGAGLGGASGAGNTGGGSGGGLCSADGWCWMNPVPQGHWLQAVWVSPSGTPWAAGIFGTVLRQRGGQWERLPTGTQESLNGIWGSADDDVWAVGGTSTSVILHYDGTAWDPVTSPTSSQLNAVWGTARGDAWASGQSGAILRLAGTSWTVVTGAGGNTDNHVAIGGTAADDVWFVGSSPRVLHFSGGSWTSTTAPLGNVLFSVWAQAATNVWIGGQGYGMFGEIYQANGTTVNLYSPYSDYPVQAIWGAPGAAAGWAVSNYGLGKTSTIWRVDATTFTSYLAGVPGAYVALGGQNDSNAWAVGQAGAMIHWDGGAWSKAWSTSVNDVFITGAWMAAPDDGWAVASEGTILRWNGTRWAPFTSNTASDLGAVHGIGPSDVWAGAGTQLLHFDGTSWSVVPSFLPYSTGGIAAIWASASDDLWVADNTSSGAVISHWNGTAWGPTTLPYNISSVWRLWSPTPGDVWALGGTVFRRNGAAATFTQVPTAGAAGTYWLAMWGASATDAWLVGAGGAIQHWDGSAFQSVSSPTTQDLEDIRGTGARDIYATGTNGAIVHWDGTSWKAESADTGIELRAIAFTGANDVQVFGDATGILRKQR